MSFVQEKDIQVLDWKVEQLFEFIFLKVFGKTLPTPFKRSSF